jgi:hypothetical protein
VTSDREFCSWLTAVTSSIETLFIFMVTSYSFWYTILVMVAFCGLCYMTRVIDTCCDSGTNLLFIYIYI